MSARLQLVNSIGMHWIQDSVILFMILIGACRGRIHTLSVVNDDRPVIILSSFGFLEGGYLKVNVTNLKIHQKNIQPAVGFSFDKSSSSGTSSYVEREESKYGCVLETDGRGARVFDDVPQAIMRIEMGEDKKYKLTQGDERPGNQGKDTVEHPDKIANNNGSTKPLSSSRHRRAAVEDEIKWKSEYLFEEQQSLPLEGSLIDGLSVLFYVHIEKKEQIGLYELYFHNCEVPEHNLNPGSEPVAASFTAHITEMNGESFLSAGDMALPLMYGVVSSMFFTVGVLWIRIIHTTKETVFKIHYLMAVLVLAKGMSAMFHSLDCYFISKDGRTEGWAVIFYIVHFLKDMLLIICLLLIGMGWAFIKNVLSTRDKVVFMIVILMQVMVNIAYIIMEGTEEGTKSYYRWKNIVVLVDILCCGAIIIPLVWNIRYLERALKTDGDVVPIQSKLQLYRIFGVMVGIYLYISRIVVYLLEISLPFQYSWIHAFFIELVSFLFFSITGYKFRPKCDNRYLKLDGDEHPEEIITQSGAMENIIRVNKKTTEDETEEYEIYSRGNGQHPSSEFKELTF